MGVADNLFYRPVVLLGMITTAIGVIFITIGVLNDYKDCIKLYDLPPLQTLNVLTALGTIFFTYGGHSAFPTIQHDMKKPSEFNKTALLSFSSKFLLYIIF